MSSPTRISKPELFLRMATLVAERSTCPRGSVGAVLTRDHHPISIGYNGSPPGVPHCDEVGCAPPDGCLRTIHAEQNAIAFAARYGHPTEGTELWCTHSPCVSCAKTIVAAGVAAVIYMDAYRDTTGIEVLLGSGVTVIGPSQEEAEQEADPLGIFEASKGVNTFGDKDWEWKAEYRTCSICDSKIVRQDGNSLVCERGHHTTHPEGQPTVGFGW